MTTGTEVSDYLNYLYLHVIIISKIPLIISVYIKQFLVRKNFNNDLGHFLGQSHFSTILRR